MTVHFVGAGPGAAEAIALVPTLVGLDDHHRALIDARPPALARLARRSTGYRMGATGDLEGSLTNVKVGAKDIKLTIDKVKP